MAQAMRRVEVARALRIALLFGVVLLLVWAAGVVGQSPCVGVADIHDFWRVMRPAGIHYLEPLTEPGVYVRCTFRCAPADLGHLSSSSAVLAWVAKHLTWGLPEQPATMDLRQMGLLDLAILAAMTVAAVAVGLPAAVLLGLVYVLVDPGYLLFFNSFYADATLLLALFGLVVWMWGYGALPVWFWALSWPRFAAASLALLLLVALGGGAKMQFVLLPGLVFGVLAVPLFVTGRRFPCRAAVLGGPLLLLAVIIPLHFFVGSGPRFLWANNYHAVYGGILRLTDDPDGALRRLGVSEEFWGLPRRDVFSGHIPPEHPVHQELAALSRWRLLRLYLSEPEAIVRAAEHVQRALARVETHPRGNRIRDPSQPGKRTFTTTWQFARWRGIVYGSWPPVLWVGVLLAATWLVVTLRRRRWNGAAAACSLLLLWALSQMVVVVLGEGMITFAQHLMSARCALDLVLVIVICEVSRAWLEALKDQPAHGGARYHNLTMR